MNLKRLAIVTGGLNEERTISLKSAQYVLDHLNPEKYQGYMVDMQGPEWICGEGKIDKNDFSLETKDGIIHFDGVLMILHGHPAEDGRIQGYFEMLDIPYSGCNTFTSALTFHKEASKHYLKPYDVPMASSIMLRKGDKIDYSMIEPLGMPLFVKPNKYGSSFGVTKIKAASELDGAIKEAFKYDDDVMVESFIEGREIQCGLVNDGDEIIALPLTEIISHNEFFDYEAKYHGASDEITPAHISPHLTKICQDLSKQIYTLLYCNGVVRIDYILKDDTYYLLEVNSIPGLSPASIVPQQARAYGWTDRDLVEKIVKSALNKK